MKKFKDSTEREKLIRVLYAIEGLTYYEDDMLDEDRQDSFCCKVYGLVHGVLSELNIGCHYGREEKCVHTRELGSKIEDIEERLKGGHILDIEKIFRERIQ